MWSVFRLRDIIGDADRDADALEVEALFASLAEQGVVVRGLYDVSGLRADADLMVWWHAEDSEHAPGRLQRLPSHDVRPAASTRSGRRWRCTARPSSTSRTSRPSSPTRSRARTSASTRSCGPTSGTSSTTPSVAGCSPQHGQQARGYADVRANTVASFALGDYEWMLAFEADELHRIVDLMRDLRASDARRHVREEVPFYTGARVAPAELIARLP